MKRFVLTIGILSGIGALFYGLYRFYKYQIELVMTYCYRLTKIKFNKLNNNRINFDVFLKVLNNSDFIITISGYEFDILLDNKVIGKVQSSIPTTIYNKKVTEIGINVNFDPVQIFDLEYIVKLIANMVSDKSKVVLTVKGSLKAKMQFISVNMPINITMSMADILAPDDPKKPKQVCNI